MKKKMLFMAAIAGLISLGSCVKDDVSGSVEAVRNAKANQLNADANYKNAQAAVQQAAAELAKATQSALVAQEQAEAKRRELANEATSMTNQVTAAALEDEIANTIADYKAQLAGNQALLQTNLNALENAVRQANADAYKDLQKLTDDYADAFAALSAAQATLLTDQLTLEGAKTSYEYAVKAKENKIKAQKKIIEQNEMLIEKLNALKEKVGEGANAEELAAEAQALFTEAEIEAAAFGASEEVAALKAASLEWATAYAAYQKFEDTTNPTKGYFGKLNAAVNAEFPGEKYYTPGTSTVDIDAAEFNYGVVASYEYAIVTTTKPHTVTPPTAPSYTGANLATVSHNVYTISEEGKYLFDKKVATFTEDSKEKLADETKTLAEEEEYLGKASDTKDTKTAKTNDKHSDVKTTYAEKKQAEADLATAKTNKDNAEKDLSGKPGDLKTAITNLMAENGKGSPNAAKQLDLTIKLAQAIEAVYGAAANRASLPMEITSQADANDYVYGASTALDFTSNTDVEGLFKWGSTFVPTTPISGWKTGADATHDGVDYVVRVINRKSGSKSVVEAYEDAVAKLGLETDQESAEAGTPITYAPGKETAYSALGTAIKGIADQELAVAKQKDKVNTAQSKADDAEAQVEEWKKLIADADLEAYDAAIADLEEATAAFDEAAAAVADAQSVIDDKLAMVTALNGAYADDIDDQILAAEDAIAKAEKKIKDWESANNEEQLIAAAEAQVAADMADVQRCVLDLAAAKAALEAAVGSLEPEEPSEEPAEEPAEGEGEGEAEGGEEAPAEGEGE